MILGITPARGGSKGIVNKNLTLVNNKPLIAYAIDCGNQAQCIDYHIVSTDSQKIAEIAIEYGAEVPFIRPIELAADDTPMLPVLQHAIKETEKYYSENVEALIVLDPTAPLRIINDVEEAFSLFTKGNYDAVISAHTAKKNPYFNMVMKKGELLSLVCEPEVEVNCRQEAPEVFELNTVVWIYSREALMIKQKRIPERSEIYIVPENRVIDIDTKYDLTILNHLINYE